MKLERQNLLFFTRTMKMGGTENVVLQLCEIFKPLVNKIVVCSCGGVNVEKLTEMGIVHYQIPDIEEKKPSQILFTIKELKRIIKTENISIIHTHHRMAAFYVSLLGLYRKCCFINTSHNTFNNRLFLTRFSYKHCNLVACGEMVKKNLVNTFGLPDNQVTVIRNAIKGFDRNISESSLITDLHNRGYYIVGNIGRLSKQKGMEYFLKSIPYVIEKHENVRFVIIGVGEEEEKLKQLAASLNIEDYVYFLGYRNDIQNIMSQLDLIILSSLWEGLPLTPIEAFSVGKTVIATAVDGTLEIVRDGIDGLLVPPKNSIDISNKIIWMLEHHDKQCEMERNAQKRYTDEFAFCRLAQEYIEYYERL